MKALVLTCFLQFLFEVPGPKHRTYIFFYRLCNSKMAITEKPVGEALSKEPTQLGYKVPPPNITKSLR